VRHCDDFFCQQQIRESRILSDLGAWDLTGFGLKFPAIHLPEKLQIIYLTIT
jgi:hypothetical protein